MLGMNSKLMVGKIKKNWVVLFLIILLLVSFILRFSGVFWGIPPYDTNYYHPDEPKVIDGAYRFPADILTREDLRYPTALHYLIGIITWPIKMVNQQPDSVTYRTIYLSGRLLSVVLGTATVLLLYWLARRQYNVRTSLVAAIALAFMMYHVTNSSWSTTDVATSFFLTLFLLLLLITLDRNSIWLAMMTGAALGLLVGTKYTGGLAVFPFTILILGYAFRNTQEEGVTVKKYLSAFKNRLFWIICLTAIIIFFISTPSILLRPSAFITSIQAEQGRMAQARLPLYQLEIWKNSFVDLTIAVGIPLAITSCLGLIVCLVRRRTFEAALAILVIIFFLYFDNALLPRYIILIMPVLALISGCFIESLLSSKQSWVKVFGWGITFVVLAFSLLYTIQGVLSRYPDTRTQAAAYVRRNIPPGSEIGIAYSSEEFGWKNHFWRYPKIDFKRYKELDFLEKPEYLIVSDYDSKLFKDTLQRSILLEDMTLPKAYVHEWYGNSSPSPEIFTFYKELFSKDSPYELVQKFAPERIYAPIEFPAPTLEIYRKIPES